MPALVVLKSIRAEFWDTVIKMEEFLTQFFNENLHRFFQTREISDFEASLRHGSLKIQNLDFQTEGINEILSKNGVDVQLIKGRVGTMLLEYNIVSGNVTIKMNDVFLQVKPNAFVTAGKILSKKFGDFLNPPEEPTEEELLEEIWRKSEEQSLDFRSSRRPRRRRGLFGCGVDDSSETEPTREFPVGSLPEPPETVSPASFLKRDGCHRRQMPPKYVKSVMAVKTEVSKIHWIQCCRCGFNLQPFCKTCQNCGFLYPSKFWEWG
eukprot:GHVP01049606.1.p1 GENE.GHVP01049606.1~~GHVP01049606.1.p1  ORF type:complete len:265 (+),score=40.03 GHVP01049606.1:613-1407(+)